jgi:uncharacterized protein
MKVKGMGRFEFGHELEKYFRPASPIVDAQLLQGRRIERQQVGRAAATTGRSVFIWGDRGVGKTSLAVASARENLPLGISPIQHSCDDRMTMLQVVRGIVDELLGRDPLKNGNASEFSAGLNLGFVKVEGKTGGGRATDFANTNEAVRALQASLEKWMGWAPHRPIVVVDEFGLLPEQERRYFGDLIKQVGDRRLPVSLIFCGVAASLEDYWEDTSPLIDMWKPSGSNACSWITH